MSSSSVAEDTTAPIVTISSPKDKVTLEGNMVILKGTSTDADSGVKRIEYKTDEEDTWFHITDKPSTPDWSVGIGFETEGLHNITVRAKDYEGNKGEATIQVKVKFPKGSDPELTLRLSLGLAVITLIIITIVLLFIRSSKKKVPKNRSKGKKKGPMKKEGDSS